jgi:hypothetical protein
MRISTKLNTSGLCNSLLLLLALAISAPAFQGGVTVTVAQLLANPSRYDGRRVTVTGEAFIVRRQGGAGSPWTLMSLADFQDRRKVMNVICPGHAAVRNGDVARATGVFRIDSRRGRYTYKNELICERGGIVRDERRSEQKQAAERANVRPGIDLRNVVPRRFDLGLVRGRVAGLGTELRVRFQTRVNSHSHATGIGAASVRVERAERRRKPGGGGSTPAGPGRTWLIVRIWLRGSPSNTGMPETFHQSLLYQDPPPAFFLAGRDGTVYWPDSSWSSAVTYAVKTDKPMRDIRTNSARWTRSGLAFRVPEVIQDPVLVVLTYQGGNRWEYAGLRLY